MKARVLFCLALLTAPLLPSASADDPPTCGPNGWPCVALQETYDDLVWDNVKALSNSSPSTGWLNLEPGNVRFQPLLDLPAQLADNTMDFSDGMVDLLWGAGGAATSDTQATARVLSTWVLATAGEVPGNAEDSAITFVNAGDAILVVTITEAGAWVSFVNEAGVTLASAAVGVANGASGSAATVQRAATGGDEYVLRKANESLTYLIKYLTNPPTKAAQRDVDENGVGDKWEDTVCRSRLGTPGLPSGACQEVNNQYHFGRSHAAADFDGDGLSLLDEYRWNSDPLDPDTDKDGLPDGPEADLWRRSESELTLHANLWTCPSRVDDEDPDGDKVDACSWRHPDSFRDDDGDKLANMGQDPAGPLEALGAGDADSEDDGLTDGDEYYGCHTDPLYGANDRRDPGVIASKDPNKPDFRICGGSSTRGHGTDPLEVDTDGDRLSDREEVCSATGGACSRTASYNTDPLALDTDGDSWNDGDEAEFWRTTDGGWFNDIDQDGRVNNLNDPDSDMDGIQDGVEASHTLYGKPLRPDLWDTDDDGMPDPWEIRNRLNPVLPNGGTMGEYECQTPDADADGDGLCNLFEYAFQRDSSWNEAHQGEWRSPLNPQEADMDGDDLTDSYEVYPYRIEGYYLRYAQQPPDTPDTTLGQYNYGRDFAYTGYPGSTRVDLADTDKDGLMDAAEQHTASVFGTYTNPNAPDSDLDGIGDVRETHSDPAHWDTDGDGIADSEEEPGCVQANDCDGDDLPDGEEGDCDPRSPDSDGDGLTDREEKDANSDCNKRDTDGDGLNDFEEVRRYGTRPGEADSDGDGLNDFDEVNGTPNAWHHAHHATLGDYRYVVDRCGRDSPACATPGATDPMNPDSDGDGWSDGDEVLTERLSTLCSGGVCEYRFTNPNRADTDGDGLPDKREATELYCTRYFDPTNYDMDGDFLSDGAEYEMHETDACYPDTDNDRLEDGAEVQLGTSPVRWSSDADFLSDLHDLDPLNDNEAPSVMGILRPYGGGYDRGACIRVADGSTVSVSRVAVFAREFQTDGGPARVKWWDSPQSAAEYHPVANPLGWRWDGLGDAEAICLQWSGTVHAFNVTFNDEAGNHVSVEVGVERNLELDYIQLSLTALCFATAGSSNMVIKGVGTGAKVFSVAYNAENGDTFEAVTGAVSLVKETYDEYKHVNGKPVGETAKFLTGPIGCVLDAARGNFVRETGTEVQELHITSSDDRTLMHAFRLPSTAAADIAYLAAPGEAKSDQIFGGGTSKTVVRGTGYSYLSAKHQDQGHTPDEWRKAIQEILDTGTHTTEAARRGAYWTDYDVYTSPMANGETWSVYVHGRWIYDVEIR